MVRKKLVLNLNKVNDTQDDPSPTYDDDDLPDATAENIFDALVIDCHGKNTLDYKGLCHLFDRLNLNVRESMKRKMFSHCDKAGDGRVNKTEFIDAWEWLQDELAERIANEMGVGYYAVIQTVIAVLLFMACFFLFLVYHLRVVVLS